MRGFGKADLFFFEKILEDLQGKREKLVGLGRITRLLAL